MKKKFSTKWKASKQPRKQRKYRANAPLHIKRKMLGANLAKTLREKYKRRSVSVRKGDKVKVMKGAFKGKSGKITTVQTKKLRVAVEGLQRSKKDGTKVNVWFDTSNLQVQELNLDDKQRIKSLNKEEKKVEKKTETKEVKSEEKKGEKK
jgi:large subunit ribosomal protein L24